MKSAIIFVAFAIGALAAPAPAAAAAAQPEIEERTITRGTCKAAVNAPGVCNFPGGSAPCGVNYKCKYSGEPCQFNSSGGHAHCNL